MSEFESDYAALRTAAKTLDLMLTHEGKWSDRVLLEQLRILHNSVSIAGASFKRQMWIKDLNP